MTTAGVVALAAVVAVVALAIGVLIGRQVAARVPAAAPAPVPPPSPDPQAKAVDNLPTALWNLPLGIVVAAADGAVVYRNAMAQRFSDARHGDALVEDAIRGLLGVAARGERAERLLDLYGPPRRRLVVKAAPLLVDDAPAGSLVIVEDVTEQQRLDTVRRDFVANVSHELKTPVGAIGVLAEALQGEDDPEVVDRLATRLQTEAFRLGHTIDDLLALSRIESGELFDPAELDLAEVVAAALERNASAAERREVQLEADGLDDPVVVLGDRAQLVSAVANLVDNAIKYSDPGSRVEVRVAASGDRASITVSDRGVGIPEADLERIFERFYRVDPARSRNTGGTGLGLSIVRHVTLNHGGEVTVRSTEGVGSTFTLHLPLTAPPAAAVGDRPTDPFAATPRPEPDQRAGVTQE